MNNVMRAYLINTGVKVEFLEVQILEGPRLRLLLVKNLPHLFLISSILIEVMMATSLAAYIPKS